jgi:hypothetical protein
MNAAVRAALGSPLLAALVNFLVGLVALVALTLAAACAGLGRDRCQRAGLGVAGRTPASIYHVTGARSG